MPPTVEVIFPVFVVFVFLLFLRSSYGSPFVKDKTPPDLRVSEYAPDLASVPNEYTRKLNEKERKEAEKKAFYAREALRCAEMEKERSERRREAMEADKQSYLLYGERIREAKAKRWREGNPVTRENPLKDHEQPPRPFVSSIYY